MLRIIKANLMKFVVLNLKIKRSLNETKLFKFNFLVVRSEHQILFMLPILDGLCNRHKIKKIVFEKDFSKKIKKEKALKNLFKNYQIETIQNIKDHDKSIFNYIVSFSWIVYFFFKSFFISRSKLLSKKNDWYTCQVNHSIWDTCIINNKKT